MNPDRSYLPRNQLPGLDLARFLAACLVMVYHLGYSSWAMDRSTANMLMDGRGESYPELVPLAWFGWVGVEIFFVISGFVIVYSASRSSALQFAKARLIRLYPAAWAAATLSLGAILLITHDYSGLPMQYLRSIALWPFGPWLDGVYWTLGVEMVFYSLVFLCLLGAQRNRLALVTNAIGLVSAAFYAYLLFLYLTEGMPSVVSTVRSSRFITLALLSHGIFFAIGALLYQSAQTPLRLREKTWLILLLVLGIVEILLEVSLKASRDLTPLDPQWRFVPALVWLAMVGLIMRSAHTSSARKPGLLPPATLRHVGLITYPLYLIHATCGTLLIVLFSSLGCNKWIGLLFSMMGCVLLSSMLVSAIEQPLQAKLRRWMERNPDQPLTSETS